MSVYIPHYQHDIFVSYAQVDNEPLTEAETGWVTTLVTTLRKLLGQKLGRLDAYSLWMPDRGEGQAAMALATHEQLKGSATLLLILSPGYLASSSWTELQLFLQHVGPDSKRLFVVEKDWVEREQKPLELQALPGYPFWVESQESKRVHTLGVPKPNPDREPEYYARLDDLARQLATALRSLQESVGKGAVEAATVITLDTSLEKSQEVIFLAEVTDDLSRARDQVKRYLEQHGVPVLPSTPYYFHTAAELQQALKADLRKASMFVQLLSDSRPQRPEWMTTPVLQWEQAKQVQGLSLLQWRNSQVELEKRKSPPKVFITYSGESREHAERVLALSDRLRAEGIDCDIDQYYLNVAEGWARWMLRKVNESNYVLVVCTKGYYQGVIGEGDSGVGKDAKWGSAIIADAIYDGGKNNKFIPVLFSPEEKANVPEFLLSVPRYVVSTKPGYEDLYRRLTDQPPAEKPELGNRVSNATYRALLEGSIAGMTLEEFQQYIIQQLAEKRRIKEAAEKRRVKEEAEKRQRESVSSLLGYNSVFVNAYPEDKELASQIGKLLAQQHGMLCFYPRLGGNPQELREDLKGHFSECDVVLIIYGKSPLRWIDSQIKKLRFLA